MDNAEIFVAILAIPIFFHGPLKEVNEGAKDKPAAEKTIEQKAGGEGE